MRNDQIGVAVVPRRFLDQGEQNQQRDRSNNLRHHERLIDHGIDGGLAAIGACACGTKRRHRGQHGGDDRGDRRHDNRSDRRTLNEIIFPGGNIPAQRQSFPQGDVVARIERIDDQWRQRHVQGKKTGQRQQAESRHPLD